ncbi:MULTISPECIES: triose-phosphate isomerase [Rhizobium]|uniref:Triosephosphate isomerase n=1 Tax=Rhizobium favelukesii TaxID=348824 RepID=W6S4S2_9HYPH|nr:MULTISPECIES: triose-phosphate isomerase [Rhizobium]MCS0459819.1 triose-phosphate isomerase [Rhizobium favelukesii]UFS85284.1 triose-phosphate isomerase [Rhizobium sp. T136]CDM61296.1 triosephosphate isomerase (TIM) [Rhizobium favelukesii]
MRKLVAGNWKMYGLASSLAEIEALKGLTGEAACDIVVCPPFTLLEKAAERAKDSTVAIGAQDCHRQISDAYTGDVSAEMLVDPGARFVILGHSERRVFHHETDAMVATKVTAARTAGLTAIICVGETRSERGDGKAIEVVGAQLRASVPAGASSSNLVIAYEPVWAIGTGLVPTIEQIEEIHSSIRQRLEELGEDRRNVRIPYGGSVKASNAAAIFGAENVDGALVGGASLKATEFAGIISAAA